MIKNEERRQASSLTACYLIVWSNSPVKLIAEQVVKHHPECRRLLQMGKKRKKDKEIRRTPIETKMKLVHLKHVQNLFLYKRGVKCLQWYLINIGEFKRRLCASWRMSQTKSGKNEHRPHIRNCAISKKWSYYDYTQSLRNKQLTTSVTRHAIYEAARPPHNISKQSASVLTYSL